MDYEKTYRSLIDSAKNAVTQEEHQSAINGLSQLADVYPKAAYELFKYFKNAYPKEAYEYLISAADRGYENARIKVAECLAKGIYFEKNERLALEILLPYCDKVPFAANLSGCIYIEGTQVERDMKKAVHYFSMASEQGYGQATFNIGLICAGNYGIKGDDKKALEWFGAAAEQGFAAACMPAAHYSVKLNDLKKACHYLQIGCNLGEQDCIRLYPALCSELFPTVSERQNIRQSSQCETDICFTGQKIYTETPQSDNVDEDIYYAVAAKSGGGVIDKENNIVYGNKGLNFIDNDGFIIGEDGISCYDSSTGYMYSFGTGKRAIYDDSTETYYDLDTGKTTTLFEI